MKFYFDISSGECLYIRIYLNYSNNERDSSEGRVAQRNEPLAQRGSSELTFSSTRLDRVNNRVVEGFSPKPPDRKPHLTYPIMNYELSPSAPPHLTIRKPFRRTKKVGENYLRLFYIIFDYLLFAIATIIARAAVVATRSTVITAISAGSTICTWCTFRLYITFRFLLKRLH